MLFSWKPRGDHPVRDDLLERMEELEGFIKSDQEELSKLKQELHHYDYKTQFDRVTKGKKIPWDKLCWPGSGNGGLPKHIVCIVCRKGFVRFQGNHQTGSFKGGGLGQPNIYVHERCMPEHVLTQIKNDIW